MVVEAYSLGGQIVGAEDGRVAAGSSPAHVPLVEDGDLADPMPGGEIVRRRQAMHPGTDNHHVVAPGEVVLPPDPRPSLPGEAMAEQAQGRVGRRLGLARGAAFG